MNLVGFNRKSVTGLLASFMLIVNLVFTLGCESHYTASQHAGSVEQTNDTSAQMSCHDISSDETQNKSNTDCGFCETGLCFEPTVTSNINVTLAGNSVLDFELDQISDFVNSLDPPVGIITRSGGGLHSLIPIFLSVHKNWQAFYSVFRN